MISKRALISSAIATVVAMGAMAASAQDKDNMDNMKAMEKCYGVVAAGKNDCAGNGHACQGQSTKSADAGEFIALPAGICERLEGGSTSPAMKKK
jgi:uncharacterized membrane protein